MRMKFVTTTTWSLSMSWSFWRKRSDCVKEEQNNTTTSPREIILIHVRTWFWYSALDSLESRMNCADNNYVAGFWTCYLTLRAIERIYVWWQLMDLECFSFLSSLCFQLSVGSMTALLSVLVTYWHVTGWRFFVCFSEFFLLFFLLSSSSSHGWYICTHGHPHISRHRPLKTTFTPAVHIHVSTSLTCGISEKPSEVV